MPSGAKKRKAAKKKKQNQSNNPSHLNGDVDRESDDGENRSPKSQEEEEEIAEESRVKSDDKKQLEVGESVKIEDDGGSSRSGSNSDDENRGGMMKDRDAESSVDSTKVGDYVSLKSIEATSNTPLDDSVVGEKITLLIEQVEVPNEQSPSDIFEAPPCVVQSAVKENGEKKFNTSVEDKISSSSLERTIDQSDADPRSNNGAQHVKESLVIQPLFPGEKTSWKSCCGLFEVFNRSAA